MNIADRLQDDMKAAMRSGDKARLGIIRMARAALQTAQQDRARERFDAAVKAIEARESDSAAREAAIAAISIDPRAPLDDEAQEAVLAQEVKRRQNAADIFRKNGRDDKAEEEEAEVRILVSYLPERLGPDELRPQVAALIAELGLRGPASMGKLMPTLLERFKGRADGRVLSQLARELLAGG
jgi:uncharacterized protein YqeY